MVITNVSSKILKIAQCTMNVTLGKECIIGNVVMGHHLILTGKMDTEIVLVQIQVRLQTAILMTMMMMTLITKAHLVNGLNGVHVLSPVDMVDTKYVPGSALVNTAVQNTK